MLIEIERITSYMGELYAAALHDLQTADPSHVGLNGISIVAWREAYFEGIKDTIAGIATRIPDEQRDEVGKAVRVACDKHLEQLKAEAKTAPAES